jgi:hypothetical protein
MADRLLRGAQIQGGQPTGRLLVSTDLDALRRHMMAWGLHCITRFAEDEPHIVEVWL